MTKLRLKVKEIAPNGAVIMVPDIAHEVQTFDKLTSKLLTEAQSKKAKPGDLMKKSVQIHPSARLIFVPLKDDKTKYAIDQVYEFELKKA